MRRILAGLVFGVLLCATNALAADLNEYFTLPKEWRTIPSGDSRMLAFQTALDKKDSLLIMVRPIRAGGQSPMQWATDEVAAIAKQGFQLKEAPADATIGKTKFVKLASWNDLAGFGCRHEQYFTEFPKDKTLIEFAILGPEEFFAGQRGNIESFLQSFHFA